MTCYQAAKKTESEQCPTDPVEQISAKRELRFFLRIKKITTISVARKKHRKSPFFLSTLFIFSANTRTMSFCENLVLLSFLIQSRMWRFNCKCHPKYKDDFSLATQHRVSVITVVNMSLIFLIFLTG